MASKSNIEWTGHTWNPLAGCSVLTPGCKRCYAMKMAARLDKMGQALYAGLTEPSKAGPVWTGEMRRASDDVLLAPLRRKKPTTYFVNSMSDLFHENVPDEWIDRVFAVMALCLQHTFQVLTKRAARMRRYITDEETPSRIFEAAMKIATEQKLEIPDGVFEGDGEDGFAIGLLHWPLPNVWLGVSAERQQEWDERKEHLRATPAAVHFASFEPLLGGIIELRPISDFLQWAIVGGESGHGYRLMQEEWARGILAQCAASGTAVFMKQMAGKKPIPADLLVREFPVAT